MIKIKRIHLISLSATVLCIIIILMLSVCWKNDGAAERKGSPQVPEWVSCLGRVVPGERVIRVTAAPQVVLKELRVKRWDHVKKGQVIAVLLDYDTSLASLQEAEARVAVAEGHLAKVKAGEKTGTIAAQEAVVASQESGLKTARSNYERYKVLFDNSVISRSRYEDAELALEKALRSVEEAQQILVGLRDVRPVDVTLKERELSQARASRNLAKAKLELCVVRSPIDGQVIEINTYPGESIGQAGILNLANQVLMVDAEVYVTDISKVRIGSKAVITGDGIEGEVKGTVAEVFKSVMDNGLISPNPLAFSDRRVIRARIRIEESEKIAALINSQVFVKILP
jgi:HlyD family secretion protein